MNDEYKIFQLYLENAAAKDEPRLTVHQNGDKEWRLHGMFHREDGPAREFGDVYKAWYLHGKLHREDGPAIEHSNGSKTWALHGKFYDAEQWAKALLKQRKQPHDDEAVNAFLKTMLRKDIEMAL